MKVYRGFKAELDPNDWQISLLKQHVGAARWAYNWGLAEKRKAWAAGEKLPSRGELDKLLRVLKKSEPSLGWLAKVSSRAPEAALINLEEAFTWFFDRVRAKKEGKFKGKLGFPKFKTKRRGLGSYTVHGEDVRISPHGKTKWIQLPVIGKIRLKEHDYLPNRFAVILTATVSERAGRWFVSLNVEQTIPDPSPKPPQVVGVDLGISRLATCSDGKIFENPNAIEKNLKKLRRLGRQHCKKVLGGKRREKLRHRLAKLHYRIFCQRQDAIHKMTSELTKTKSVVVIEDLNVAGMVKNHKVARRVLDSAFFEIRRQLVYKGSWYGCEVLAADMFFPSSMTCSKCSTVNETLKLFERSWVCSCGARHDRDLNAAQNLKQLAGSSSDRINVRGGVVPLLPAEAGRKRIPTKRKVVKGP